MSVSVLIFEGFIRNGKALIDELGVSLFEA